MSTVPDTTIDPALQEIAEATQAHLVTAEPANHAGIAAVSIGNATLTAGDGNGDWVIANGDTSGRKITLSQQTGISITDDGTVVGIAFTDGTTLKFYKLLSASKAYNNGDTAEIPSFDVWEINDPTDS